MKSINILLFFLIVTTFILLGFLFSQFSGKVTYEQEKANLTRVIDGDTIETSIGKIRLLGINTPEKKELGYEQAKLFLEQFQGKEITLERTNENKDRYGRLLRYLFYNNQLINEEILSSGLAHLYVYEEDSYTSRLKKAENQARNKELGIWEKSKNNCSSCIILVEINEKDPGEYVLLKNNCDFTCNLQDWTIKDEATNTKKLDFSILGKEEKRIDYEGRVWNDAGDTLYLRDNKGLLVLFYRY